MLCERERNIWGYNTPTAIQSGTFGCHSSPYLGSQEEDESEREDGADVSLIYDEVWDHSLGAILASYSRDAVSPVELFPKTAS